MLGIAAGLFAGPAQAATFINVSTGYFEWLPIGYVEDKIYSQAQRFVTGPNTAGYERMRFSVKVRGITADTGLRARLFSESGGKPHTSLGDIPLPDDFNLAGNTTYFVVFDSDQAGQSGEIEGSHWTAYNTSAGWSKYDNRHYQSSTGGNWREVIHNTDAIQGNLANASLNIKVDGQRVTNATGKPGITGFPQVGEVLTATLGDIADPDGLPSFPGKFQFFWDGAVTSSSSTYTPVAGDIGTKIRVRVKYRDMNGTDEIIWSDDTSTNVIAARPACPSNADWCGVLTAGASGSVKGYSATSGLGSVDDDAITFGGETWTIEQATNSSTSSSAGDFNVTLDKFLPSGTSLKLDTWQIGGPLNEMGPGQYEVGAPTSSRWVAGQRVTIYAKFPRDNVTIARKRANSVYKVHDNWFTVRRQNNTRGALDVRVKLRQDREYVRDADLVQIVTIPDGASSADVSFAPGELKPIANGARTDVSGEISAEIISREWYIRNTPWKASTTMHYGMTVGFEDAAYEVDEGSGTVTATLRAIGAGGLPAPTQEIAVTISNVSGTASSGTDYVNASATRYFPPGAFTYNSRRDWYEARRTVSWTIQDDNQTEGNETFKLLMSAGPSNPPGVVYVDSGGTRGLKCTEGGNCTTTITIVDNDGITTPTENPDWTLQGSGRTFAGTSSEHGNPTVTGTEDAVRCLNGSTPWRLRDHNDNPVSGTIGYSLHVAERLPGYHSTVPPADIPGMFTIDDDGQIRTVVGKDYPHGETGGGNLQAIYVTVRATHDNRYAEHRTALNIMHPDDDYWDANSPTCMGLQVSQDPLRGAFVGMPASHDGSTPFTFRIDFTEGVDIEPDEMRDHAMIVSNATVDSAVRIDGRDDLWEITLTPGGAGALSVLVEANRACTVEGALCTSDGRMLDDGIGHSMAYVPTRPGLSIADAEVEEGANARLVFTVTLSEPADELITVVATTSDGSATAGEDYEANSRTKRFRPGETTKYFRVNVLDDAIDEGNETLTVTLSNVNGEADLADATATGTIRNSDHMPQAWLARFGRTVADQVLDAVEGRVTAARVAGTEASLAGQRIGAGPAPEALEAGEAEARLEAFAEWMRGEETEDRPGLASRELTGRELLSGSSFALTGGTAESGFGALWGRGAISRFDGREDDLTLDGEVRSAMLGADWTGGRGMAGLVLSHSRGEGGYRSPGGDGEVESALTGIYPWGRYAVSERLSVWGVAGYGSGTLTLTPEGRSPIETDMGLAMGAVGGRGVLVQPPEDGGLEVAATSDALIVRTTSDEVRGGGGSLAASEADVTRFRLGLEGTWRGIEAGGGQFVPTLEVGVRRDGGDAETGLGADIGARVGWTDPSRGIAAELAARALIAHEDGGLRERGFAGSLGWDPDPGSERGPSLTIGQTVGAQASGGMDALLRPETARALGAANDDNELERRRLEAKLGYGFAVFGGRYTGVPEVGLGLTETGHETILGWRLLEARSTGLVFGLDVEGRRRESTSGDSDPEHRIGLGLGWQLKSARLETLELRFEASRLDPANDNPEHRLGISMTARW